MAGLVVVDTDLVIDYLRGRGTGAAMVRRLLVERRLRMTAVTGFELRLGADFHARSEDIGRLLRSRTLPLDLRSALAGGAAFARLRDMGQGIGLADCLIAGTCVRYGVPLATRNVGRFRRIPELVLEPLPDHP